MKFAFIQREIISLFVILSMTVSFPAIYSQNSSSTMAPGKTATNEAVLNSPSSQLSVRENITTVEDPPAFEVKAPPLPPIPSVLPFVPNLTASEPVPVSVPADPNPNPDIIPEVTPPEPVEPVLAEPNPSPGPLPDNITEVTHPEPVEPSPFERVTEIFPDFESQTVALHTELCGTKCHFIYNNSRSPKAKGCSPCACDHLCHVYGDCCPDVQLLNQFAAVDSRFPLTTEETKDLTGGRDVYTCEKSRLKARNSENVFYSMVNYCPRSDASRSSEATKNDSSQLTSGQSGSLDARRAMLERQCENRENSSHWHYMRPLTSSVGVVYRNQFCAQCHGQDRQNLTAWTTSVTCNADLLLSATSVKEAYFLAVNTPGCEVSFMSDQHETLRECNYVYNPVVSSCNITGLWRRYDAKVERACASFTAPVLGTYKNAFCFLCNEDTMPFEVVTHQLQRATAQRNIGRVSFYALLDVDEDDEGLSTFNSTGDGNATAAECEMGTIRDPLQCKCRPVRCGEGLHVKGNNCSQVITRTNYFGFHVCSRFHIHTSVPATQHNVSGDVFRHLTQYSGELSVRRAEAYPQVDCDDNTKMTVDIHMEFYSLITSPIKDMADRILARIQDVASRLSNQATVTISAMTPAAHCGSHPLLLPDTCATKNVTLRHHLLVDVGPVMQSIDNKLSLATLYNTTFCPHVNLSEAEFRKYTEVLYLLNLSETNITMDVISKDNLTFYLLCLEDYLRTETITGKCIQNLSGWGIIATPRGFQDAWTIIGVISIVCTCVSLVCLLAVIVIYLLLRPLRTGTGRSTMAMTCVLFVAETLFDVGVEQFEVYWLCLTLALLIHFFWLSAVFMMTSCMLQLFVSIRHPLKARTLLSSNEILAASLLLSFGLSTAIICMTLLGNQLVYRDLGYPAEYLCFIRRSLSRQLGFGLPLGLAVVFNVILFLLTVIHLRTRPHVSSRRQDRVSLVACFRLSLMTGVCWLLLFLLAVPGTRPWLDYVFVALMSLQDLLLATTLLLNKRVYNLLKHHFSQPDKTNRNREIVTHCSSIDGSRTDSSSKSTDSSSKYTVTSFSSSN